MPIVCCDKTVENSDLQISTVKVVRLTCMSCARGYLMCLLVCGRLTLIQRQSVVWIFRTTATTEHVTHKTTCLQDQGCLFFGNLEMSGNSAKVRETSGKSPKVGERSGNLCSEGNLIVASQQNNVPAFLFVL